MIKPLTSLRFFFAFFVFLSHLNFIQTDHLIYNWLKRNVFFEGYLGVSFFFILSGFVLAYSHSKYFVNNDVKLNKKKFYLARIFRVFPLHILTLLISILLLSNFKNIEVKTLFSNIFLIQSFIPDIKYYGAFNGPSWSISNEMFFYLLFPFIMGAYIKAKYRLIIYFTIYTLLLLLGATWFSKLDEKYIYYINPITRILDFIIGIFLYFSFVRLKKIPLSHKQASWLEVSAIIIFMIFFVPHNFINRAYRYSMYYWIPMSIIILVFSLQKGYISQILSHKTLIYLGEISFAFYLTHYILIQLYINFNLPIHFIITPITLFLITILISTIIFELYEKPINRYLKQKYIK